MKVEKRFIMYSLVLILITSIGFTSAYLVGSITGNKQAISVNTSLLTISGDGIVNTTINGSSSYTKTITVNNTTSKTYKYNIVLTDYTSGSGIKYKITSTSGYNMTDYSSINTSKNEIIIAYSVEIPSNTTHTYTLEIKNTNSSSVSFNGSIYISEGTTISLPTLAEAMLRDNPTVSERTNFSVTNTSNTTGTIYNTNRTEDSGTVYYYSGNTTNNWVYFGGIYWRIIRTNEDDSVRLLYAGASQSTTSGYIGKTYYNESVTNLNYGGYMYGSEVSASGSRNNTNSSTIKSQIDSWYQNNLLTNYDKYVSKTAIYCNDRATVSGSYTKGWKFGSYDRAANNYPTYKCGGNTSGGHWSGYSSADKFSVSTSGGGNGKLTYPVALMTADEIGFAGGNFATSSNTTNEYAYYFTNSVGSSITGENYWWLMSPFDISKNNSSQVYVVTYQGNLSSGGGFSYNAVRPVLSILPCARVTGTGTSTDPYVIDETNSAC